MTKFEIAVQSKDGSPWRYATLEIAGTYLVQRDMTVLVGEFHRDVISMTLDPARRLIWVRLRSLQVDNHAAIDKAVAELIAAGWIVTGKHPP